MIAHYRYKGKNGNLIYNDRNLVLYFSCHVLLFWLQNEL